MTYDKIYPPQNKKKWGPQKQKQKQKKYQTLSWKNNKQKTGNRKKAYHAYSCKIYQHFLNVYYT